MCKKKRFLASLLRLIRLLAQLIRGKYVMFVGF